MKGAIIMGLIKAGIGALGGTLADQWKEFFYCESMPKEVLVTKGQKRVGGRSSNTKGSDNIISNGSGIAVADGQCMIIVLLKRARHILFRPTFRRSFRTMSRDIRWYGESERRPRTNSATQIGRAHV